LPRNTTDERAGLHAEPARRMVLHLLSLGAFVFLFCWPLLFHGLPELADDAIAHVAWDKSFSTQLAAGEWYPRWLSDANDGLGSPVFFYYPPVASYASSAFGIVFGARDPDGWLATGCGCFLAVLLSAIGAYLWLRAYASEQAALAGAAIYVIAPYHLAVDLYVRGATAEVWSFVWLPLILLSVEALRRKSRWGFPALAVTYALLAMTHLPTVVICSPVIVAAGFFLAHRKQAISTGLRTIGAMALGAGLAAVYLIPAMFDQRKINIGYVVSPIFNFRYQWFFRPIGWGLDFPERMTIMNVTMFAFIGVLLWLCLRHGTDRGGRRVAIFYGGVTVFAFVFMSQLSYPFWATIADLRLVQFPWRFSVLPVVCAAMLTALSFSLLKIPRWRFVAIALAILVAGWIGATAWVARQELFALSGHATPAMTMARSQEKSRPGTCEYLPVTTVITHACANEAYVRVLGLEYLLAGNAAKSAYFAAGSADETSGTATVLDWKPRRVLLNVNAPEAGTLTLRHFYYAGWSARDAGTGQAIAIGPSTPAGFMQLSVPQGKHEVILELPAQPTEKAGELISLVSLAGLVAIVVFLNWRISPAIVAK
jgi:hypothetical protein